MEIPRHWRLKKQRYGLIGEICPQGHKLFPPRDICPQCGKEAHDPYQFSGKGEVYSITTLHEVPAGFEKYSPLTIALIRLAEGPIITAQLTDLEPGKEIKIGDQVEMVTRKLSEQPGSDGDRDKGVINYGYKFRPAGLK